MSPTDKKTTCLTYFAREVDRIQQKLTALAKTPTLELEAATRKPLPDTHQGVTLATAS